MHPRTRARHEARAWRAASRLAIEHATRIAGALSWSMAHHNTPSPHWRLRDGVGLELRLFLAPDPRRLSVLLATPMLESASIDWDHRTWLPAGAVIRPPHRSVFAWRDGAPGEPADWTHLGRGYVLEGVRDEMISRAKLAIASAPSDHAALRLDARGARASLTLASLADPDLPETVRSWRAYLQDHWAR